MNNLEELKKIYQVTDTDTIKAAYAQLPITGTSIRFVVQVSTPLDLIPEIIEVPFRLTEVSVSSKEKLKKVLLDKFKDSFKECKDRDILNWANKVTKVELIECDLLVPKKVKGE